MASKGKLYTSYFSSKKSQGIKIAVVRFKPDWLDFKDDNIIHFEELSPSKELFMKHKRLCSVIDNEQAWAYFVGGFNCEIKTKQYMEEYIDKVRTILDSGKDVTLICYEKDSNRCHRSLLAKYFEALGYNVGEL